MLPIVLVLFVATSAFAAPSVLVNQESILNTVQAYDTGNGYTAGLANQAWELTDQADASIYISTMRVVIEDMARQDANTQAIALGQTIAILGTIAPGIPGDSCSAASAINSYTSGRGGRSFLNQLVGYIDTLVKLAVDPDSLRYATGPRGNCAGGGRTYQFEAAWDAILNNATPYSLPILNEQYCTAKRLYKSFDIRNNDVGAVATAAALPDVTGAVKRALDKLANFLRAVINGGNVYGTAAEAKAALFAY